MGKTKYQVSGQTEFPWLSRNTSHPYSAYCAVCLKSFKIDNQGISQVKSHAKCHEKNKKKKDAVKSFLAQRIIVVDDDNLNLNRRKLPNRRFLTPCTLLDATIHLHLPMGMLKGIA